jgi:hypothetical protein
MRAVERVGFGGIAGAPCVEVLPFGAAPSTQDARAPIFMHSADMGAGSEWRRTWPVLDNRRKGA